MKTLSTLLVAFALIFTSCGGVKNVSEPQFRDISDVRVKEVGLLKTTAAANIIYYNPNKFGIKLSSARGDVYIDNIYLGSFQLDQQVSVSKRSEFILPVTLKIDNIATLRDQRGLWKKKEAMVRVEGHAFVNKAGFSKEIPIRYEQMQSVDKLRALVSR